MTQLPAHELASLSLFRATPAQAFESRRRTWPQWGGPLTEEHYLERDDKMRVMEHAINSKWITWVLAPRDSPDTLDFVSACETYKRKGIVRYGGSSETHEVTCYAVAYVFTPPHKRGNGYASHMMRLLHWVTAKRTSEFDLPHFPKEWGAPPPEVDETGNGLFSILYSALGDRFYKETGPGTEKMGGWETRHSFSSTWQIPEQDEAEQDRDIADGKWRLLKYEDLDFFWKKDAQLIRRAMENLPASHPDYHVGRPTAFVTCLPDEGVGAFHIFRSMFALEDVVSMRVWGIEKEGSPDQPAYATWTVDTKPLPPVLLITRLSATEADFPVLIKIIQEIARKNKIWKMEAWNIPLCLLGGVEKTGGITFSREKRLPCIKWYGGGETADIEWIFNEKFCWC